MHFNNFFRNYGEQCSVISHHTSRCRRSGSIFFSSLYVVLITLCYVLLQGAKSLAKAGYNIFISLSVRVRIALCSTLVVVIGTLLVTAWYSQKPIESACYVQGANLALRKSPTLNGTLITRIPTDASIHIIRESISLSEGYLWHQVRYDTFVGFAAAPWIVCKEVKTGQENNELAELFDDVVLAIPKPSGRTMVNLIEKWYTNYTHKEFYQGPLRRGWERIQGDLPLIRSMCSKYEVPYEIAFLALIESSWYPHNNNHAGAAGYWQFIPGTARDFNLVVSHNVDERLDKVKSTRAAVQYLRKLYELTYRWNSSPAIDAGDRWLFAFASYNRGARKVKKTFVATGGDFSRYADVLPDTRRLSETRNYVPKIYGARMWLRDYTGGDYQKYVIKTSSDIAYEGYLRQKDILSPTERMKYLRMIEKMYMQEYDDAAYLEGALEEIAREMQNIRHYEKSSVTPSIVSIFSSR